MTSEQTTNESEEQLRRYLSRVSYSGMGIDQTLDAKLHQLRLSIKQQESVEQLGDDVEAVTQCLHDLEENYNATQQANDPKTGLIMLAENLAACVTERHSRKALKQLVAKQSSLTLEQLTGDMSDIVKQLTESLSKPTSRWNFFSKWFGSSKTEPAENKTSDTQYVESTAKPPTHHVPEAVHRALHNFVEQLGHIEIYRKATESIRTHLENLNRFEDLSPLIEQIASVLLEAASQEHVQFENFLSKLNKRLLKVASYLNQASVNHQDLFEDTQRLDLDLKATIGEIKQEISESSGLGPLKHRLLASFEHIFNSVGRFKEAQINRVKTTQEELAIVKEQMQLTEEESQRLKQSLQEQRFRAFNDPLTELPNRYAYNDRISTEYTRWRRYRTPLSLVVIDVDHFKQVNDTQGHHGGDQVLKTIAQMLQQGIRESDFVARFGGEEFVILMPETGLNEATKAINKLRLFIANQSIKLSSDVSLKVTVSCGVAEFEGSDSTDEVFSKADTALYRAKEKGRNQVCCERSKRPGDDPDSA